MGKAQRNKGAGFEREVSARLRRWLEGLIGKIPDDMAKRKLGQARDAGNDLDVGNPNQPLLVIECKRRKSLGTIYQWLKQADVAVQMRMADPVVAGKPPHPVVIAREDGGEMLVVLHIEDFLALTSENVRNYFLEGVL